MAPVPLLPAHGQVVANIDEYVGMRAKLADKLRTRSLPQAYYTHPVVVVHPDEAVVLLAIFIDGLGYSFVDSVLAFFGAEPNIWDALPCRNTAQKDGM